MFHVRYTVIEEREKFCEAKSTMKAFWPTFHPAITEHFKEMWMHELRESVMRLVSL